MTRASDDVNERVEAEWTEETTPFERVRTVARRTYDPESAAEIAERARTTPTTARKHLRQLAESGFVEGVAVPDRDGTLYRRATESVVLEQARDVLDEVGRDDLVRRISEMRSAIDGYREEFGADSPEDAALEDADVDPQTLRDWQTTRRNLDVAKVALALAEAEETVQPNRAN